MTQPRDQNNLPQLILQHLHFFTVFCSQPGSGLCKSVAWGAKSCLSAPSGCNVKFSIEFVKPVGFEGARVNCWDSVEQPPVDLGPGRRSTKADLRYDLTAPDIVYNTPLMTHKLAMLGITFPATTRTQLTIFGKQPLQHYRSKIVARNEISSRSI